MVQKAFNNPKISIILPNYNSSNYIFSTIRSIQNQTYKNWELIIIDDCSDLKTKKILKKFEKLKKIKIIWLKKNKGTAYCRNLAIKKSKSNYYAFIDSDDIWKNKKLELQMKYMIKKKYDFTYTYYESFYNNKIKKIKPMEKYDFKSFIKDTSIATSTMILKKNLVKGNKFTNTEICEDYYFKCKALKKVKYAFCLKNYLTKYRIRDDSMQSSKLKNLYWIWKINNKYNKFGILKNIKSILLISFNSIKKYGLK